MDLKISSLLMEVVDDVREASLSCIVPGTVGVRLAHGMTCSHRRHGLKVQRVHVFGQLLYTVPCDTCGLLFLLASSPLT